ncbi:lipid-A-disaccharide synthase [Candidatus Omnitrophota bacterium]
MAKVGLIAGGGTLPVELLRSARRQGDKIVVFALEGSASPELDKEADKVYWLKIGEYKKFAFLLVKEGVRKIIFLGKVNKDEIYQSESRDAEFKSALKGMDNKKDSSIFDEITKHLSRIGVEVIDGLKYLPGLLAKAGILSDTIPTERVEKDIAFGFGIAKKIAGMDIGQTIVVKDGSVVAVEAMGGTDATIRRAREIAGSGCVMIKVARPEQDMRWDVPTIGPDTIRALAENEFSGLALESDKMFLLDTEEVKKLADASGIAVKVVERPKEKTGNNILIVSGEPSGDMRGAELMQQMKILLPDAKVWGIGGDLMEAQGADLVEHIRNLSMVGLMEIIRKLPRIHGQYKRLTENIRKRKPDIAILIDYPGFNLKVAKFLKGQGIPVVYYIIPQVWAWGKGRIELLKRFVDRALVLFDFEEKLLSDNGIDCQFVGHPLVDQADLNKTKKAKESSEKNFTIALLPGSRKHEIDHMFPVMLEAARKIKEELPLTKFVVAENSNIDKSLYDACIEAHPELDVSRIQDNTLEALDECDFAIVTSGTATLETAIKEKPMVIVYKAAFITYIIWHFVKLLPFLGLANIVAKEEVVPEVLQGNFTPENLSLKVLEMIKDPERMELTREKLRGIKHSLGEKGAAQRAAEEVYKFIEEKSLQ